MTSQWQIDECHGVLNHRQVQCLFSAMFRRTSKETSMLRVSNTEKFSMPWRHLISSWTKLASNQHMLRLPHWDPGPIYSCVLNHWGRVTHICVSKRTINGSNNGLSPDRRQAIIWTNAGILLIRTLGTNFSEILSEIHAFSFKKRHLKMSSAKWRPFVSASMG